MISFIIPAYNEEALIAATIDALHSAASACALPYEIIVANDGSTDRTAEIAVAHHARVVTVYKRQIAGTRNAGARAAGGDVFVFVDADTIVPVDTLKAALSALEAGAIGGGCSPRFDGEIPLYARMLVSVMTILFRVVKLAPGCFMFCRRSAFESTGGFDEALFASEEVSMSMALRRYGRFVVLREHVLTSGRKIRQNSPLTILGTLTKVTLTRPSKRCRTREGLDLWYDGRREVPSVKESPRNE